MKFELTRDFITALEEKLSAGSVELLQTELGDLHPADLAEILENLELEDAKTILYSLEGEISAEVLIELDEDLRGKLLEEYSGKELAEEIIENLDSDDAADLIAELSDEMKREVLLEIEDPEYAKEIADLLVYPEDTAGALMAKELVKVNSNWTVLRCVKEMRKQAEEIEHVHAVYVVDNHEILLGTLSLKKLLTTTTKTPVAEVYNPKIIAVKASDSEEEVARTMRKYDLVVAPVVDDLGRLLGRITIDDVVDVMQEEADRDYQMASGLTDDVESGDNILTMTKARLPWLLIGMFGGIMSSKVIGFFDITKFPEMALFIPLIGATGGNVGVQSSAIVVQSLAKGTFDEGMKSRLTKDLTVGLLTGVVCSLLLFALSFMLGNGYLLSATVGLSIVAVVLFAALVGTLTPLLLNKANIDPALATGPFITTTNDILGIFIYFSIGKMIFGV